MRTQVKYRLFYLVFAIASYWLGSQLMPATVPPFSGEWSRLWQDTSWRLVTMISVWYFVLLPLTYWLLMVVKGQQAKWKIILGLSLSSLIARYTYPADLAAYFEFITWLRYPIVAVILLLEIYLLVTIVKAMWRARTLSGDPRIHMVAQYDTATSRDLDSKESAKMDFAMILAHEPASWYYAIPRFSKRHVPALANIQLRSSNVWLFTAILTATLSLSVLSYLWLYPWSDIVAILVSTLVFYCVVMFVANYRVSRHFSLYEFADKLVVNNTWWGFCVINKADISVVTAGTWHKNEDPEQLFIGSQPANIELKFSRPQLYLSAMAMMKDEVSTMYLNVDNPKTVIDALNTKKPVKEHHE